MPIGRIGREVDRHRITVASHVTHRYLPGTAAAATFLNLEDETGRPNIVCSAATWQRHQHGCLAESGRCRDQRPRGLGAAL
jgi:hypothetical protein